MSGDSIDRSLKLQESLRESPRVVVSRMGEHNYHSLLWRTRRAIPPAGFLMTIQSMTDVAAESAYLGIVSLF